MSFGEKVALLISYCKTTQQALALGAGVTPPAVNQWVTGARPAPSLDRALRVAQVLGCDLDLLADDRITFEQLRADIERRASGALAAELAAVA
jgi:transcriptional regulator with XRE-family HTH domain